MKDNLFEKAYERILSEFQIILNISYEDTQKKLDKALKRNLEAQQNLRSVPPKTKSASTEIQEEDQVSDNDEPLEE